MLVLTKFGHERSCLIELVVGNKFCSRKDYRCTFWLVQTSSFSDWNLDSVIYSCSFHCNQYGCKILGIEIAPRDY